jgi:hypothetical protein
MQAKDILKDPTTSWAVVGRTSYVDKRSKSTGNVSRSSCDKVTLVNTKYYNKSHRLSDDATSFVEASSSERAKGFLVAVPASDGSNYYRVVPSSDFIGVWDDLETTWTSRESEALRIQGERERMARIQKLATQSLDDTLEDVRVNTVTASRKLLGTEPEIYLNVTGDWNADNTEYNARLGGRVTIQFTDYQRLLEKVFEAQDALA